MWSLPTQMSAPRPKRLLPLTALILLWVVFLNGCGILSEEQFIVYAEGDVGARNIAVARSDGSEHRIVIAGPSDDFAPKWSPDHTRIAFLSNRDGNVELYITPADGSSVMRVTNTGVPESQPTWSPDGKRLAYVSPDFEGHPRVYWLRLSDLLPNPLIFSSGSEVDPAWSPEGTGVAFASLNQQGISEGLFLRNPDGVNQYQLTTAQDRDPVWSPDGTKIAFVSKRDGNEEIYVLHVTPQGPDGQAIRITNDPGRDFAPQWSPDSKRVAFISDRTGNTDIYVVTDSGQDLKALTQNTIEETDFAWGKNGKIVFESVPADKPELFVTTQDGQQNKLSSGDFAASQPDW